MLEQVLYGFVTLFVIIDPVGVAALTRVGARGALAAPLVLDGTAEEQGDEGTSSAGNRRRRRLDERVGRPMRGRTAGPGLPARRGLGGAAGAASST